MSRDDLGLVPQLAADDRRRGTPDRGTPAGVGAEPVGRVVGVAFLDLDIGRRAPQFISHDLRERRLVTLALALDPELEDRLAGRMHAQLRRVEHPQPGDVVVLAGAGAHDLREAGYPATHPLPRFP